MSRLLPWNWRAQSTAVRRDLLLVRANSLSHGQEALAKEQDKKAKELASITEKKVLADKKHQIELDNKRVLESLKKNDEKISANNDKIAALNEENAKLEAKNKTTKEDLMKMRDIPTIIASRLTTSSTEMDESLTDSEEEDKKNNDEEKERLKSQKEKEKERRKRRRRRRRSDPKSYQAR